MVVAGSVVVIDGVGEVEDVDCGGSLAVPVDAAVALLHSVRVERHLHVHKPVARPVQVDALGGGISRDQHPYFGLGRVVVELSNDPLACLGVEPAVEQLDPPSRRGPIGARHD